MKTIQLPVEAVFTQPDLIGTLYEQLGQDGMFRLIRAMDEHVTDWDFSERLFKHFQKLMRVKEAQE